jgi:hypothetical protein
MDHLGPILVIVVGTRRPVTCTPVNCDAFAPPLGRVPPALAYPPSPNMEACKIPEAHD